MIWSCSWRVLMLLRCALASGCSPILARAALTTIFTRASPSGVSRCADAAPFALLLGGDGFLGRAGGLRLCAAAALVLDP